MATETVNLNNLISYDFKINFDPLLVTLAQKADSSAVTALSNQIEILKQLMGSGGGNGGGSNEGGGNNNVVFELMNQISALTTEVNGLRKERQQDTARIEALEKWMQSVVSSNHSGINDSSSHALSTADSTDITNLANRVTALEDEISHVLAQVSAELAKASPQTIMERLEQQEKELNKSSGSSNPSANPTSANTTVASFPVSSSSSAPSNVTAPSTETTTNVNVTPSSSASTPTTTVTNTVVNNSTPSATTVPSSTPSVPATSTVSSNPSSTSKELHVQTPEERILSRPRTPVAGSRTPSAPTNNGSTNATTGIYSSESYAAEIRQIGERLQALVAQVVPTAEIAAEAKILAETANKRSNALENILQHHEARLQALEKSTGTAPPSTLSNVPLSLPSSSSEDLSAAIAALRADMTKLRNQVDAFGSKDSTNGASTASDIQHLQNQINAINDSLRKLGQEPKASSSTTGNSTTVDNNLHKLEKVIEQLTERMNGIDGTIGNVKGDVSKLDTDLAALRSIVDNLVNEQASMRSKLDGTVDTTLLQSWAEATTIALTILSGNADDVTGAKASLNNDLSLLNLANRSNILSNTARPSAARNDLRFLTNTVTDMEIRVKMLEDKPELVLPEIPPPVDLTPVSAALTTLQDNKVEKGDLDNRLQELNDALANITKRINDYAKQLKSLTNANRPSTSEGKSMNDHAALSGKPLLRDLKCLSCDQPLQGLATDRGDYNPHNHVLQPHVLPSKSFMFNMTMTQQQQNGNHNGQSPRSVSPSRPQSQANIMGSLNMSGNGNNGPFNALPNGVVLNRAINPGFHTLVTNSLGRPGSTMGGNRSSPSPHGSPDSNGNDFADATVRNGNNSVRLPPLQDNLTNGVRTMEGGAPVTVVHRRGSGVAVTGSGGATIAVASPLVDPRTGAPVIHYFADPNGASSNPSAENTTVPSS